MQLSNRFLLRLVINTLGNKLPANEYILFPKILVIMCESLFQVQKVIQ